MTSKFHYTLLLTATLMLRGASAATLITGIGETSTDAIGNWDGESRWNTRGGDSIVNVFIIAANDFNGAFINGPSDAQAGVSFALSPGIHTFTMYAPGGEPNPFHGLNLFFNGNNINPRISVFGPTQVVPNPPVAPPFAPNGGITQSLEGGATPAANSASFTDGSSVVTLTDYRWADPSVYNRDRTGVASGACCGVGADGVPDWIGQFTIDVSPVPEPGISALLLLGGCGFLARLCRVKRIS